jgi:hypothetical protein
LVNVLRPEHWPTTVVPTSRAEASAAVRTLLDRAQWRDAITTEVIDELLPWFQAGWCIDAIMIALDHKPDNTNQFLPRLPGTSLVGHLQGRLAAWRNYDPETHTYTRLPPPRPGMTFAEWQDAQARNRENTALRPRSRPANPPVD